MLTSSWLFAIVPEYELGRANAGAGSNPVPIESERRFDFF